MTLDEAYWFASIGLAVLLLSVATPAAAQRAYEPLFDKFNLRLEGSWVGMSTEMRLDSEALGKGTTINFEDDLNLDGSKTIPSLGFDWQIARRHKLGVRWQDLSRGSSAQALEEIQWGDEIIPINADVTLSFDITQYFVDYAYYPWIKENWAAGFGLGIRVMELSSTLAWSDETTTREGSTDAEVTGPLPYLYFEYRRLLAEDWRFIAGLGWLQVKVEDLDGGQWVGRAGIEYLAGEHWGLGAAFNIATIDVDWKGLATDQAAIPYNGAINMDVSDFSVFARFRF